MAHERQQTNRPMRAAEAATPQQGTEPTPSAIPFQFTGNPREYFGIWIVNVLLTIVTAGIYSAWAKVRTRRYFYGHSLLDAEPFEYDAKPLTILKGRAMVAMAIVVIVAVAYFRPAVLPLLWVSLGFAFPWLLVRSLKFNAFHSRYRGLRFAFHGTYRGALGKGRLERAVHRWESQPPWVIAALFSAAVIVWAGLQYGVPVLAREVASTVPQP